MLINYIVKALAEKWQELPWFLYSPWGKCENSSDKNYKEASVFTTLFKQGFYFLNDIHLKPIVLSNISALNL